MAADGARGAKYGFPTCCHESNLNPMLIRRCQPHQKIRLAFEAQNI